MPGRLPGHGSQLFVRALALALILSTPLYAGPGDDARPLGWPNLSGQFLFGFEPTHTNPGMLLDSAYAVLKKALTGRGKGVLEIEGRTNQAGRDKYLQLLKQDCPECVITEVRESHGTLSYRITYPDRSSIGSSLDAGALEWQNSPLSVDEIHANLDRHQRHLFDLPKKAGAWMNLDALGGHVTESGYDDALFWLASLKLDAETPVMSWGFFGKDGYNATPVKRWAPSQQAAYQAVIREYEEQWVVFLKKLESLLRDPARPPSSQALRTVFASRQIMDRGLLAKKLAEIYYNPNQESKWSGKRSKPKYVAHRPAVVGGSTLLIENRAVRPQKQALDLERMARYRLRRAEFIKHWLDQGYDVDFAPGFFEGWSDQKTSAQARAFIEELGLNWSDYAHLGPMKNPSLTGAESKLRDLFVRKPYGVARRDELFQQTLDAFYQLPTWSNEEWMFVLALTEERGNTVITLQRELARLAKRFESSGFDRLPLEELDVRTRAILRLVDKYRVSSPQMFSIVHEAIRPAWARLWEAERTQNLSGWLRHLADEELVRWAQSGQEHLRREAKSRAFDLQAQIISELEHRKRAPSSPLVRDLKLDQWVRDWFLALRNIPISARGSTARALPRGLGEMISRADQKMRLRPMLEPLVNYWLGSENRIALDADEPAIESLAQVFPELENEILEPLRKRYWRELVTRGFGETDYYQAIVLADKLLTVTPIQDRERVAQELLSRVQEVHARLNTPDTQSFVERMAQELRDARKVACQASVSPGALQRFRGFILTTFKRL